MEGEGNKNIQREGHRGDQGTANVNIKANPFLTSPFPALSTASSPRFSSSSIFQHACLSSPLLAFSAACSLSLTDRLRFPPASPSPRWLDRPCPPFPLFQPFFLLFVCRPGMRHTTHPSVQCSNAVFQRETETESTGVSSERHAEGSGWHRSLRCELWAAAKFRDPGMCKQARRPNARRARAARGTARTARDRTESLSTRPWVVALGPLAFPLFPSLLSTLPGPSDRTLASLPPPRAHHPRRVREGKNLSSTAPHPSQSATRPPATNFPAPSPTPPRSLPHAPDGEIRARARAPGPVAASARPSSRPASCSLPSRRSRERAAPARIRARAAPPREAFSLRSFASCYSTLSMSGARRGF